MKSKFLDSKNCHALLPSVNGMAVFQRLDECLHQINDRRSKFSGLIDNLIEHNKKSINRQCGSDRYCDSPIEIGQAIRISDGTIHTQAIEGSEKGPAKLHLILEYEIGTTWKLILPLQFLLKGWGDANSGHQCYVHTITHNIPRYVKAAQAKEVLADKMNDKDQYYYVGITGRNWLQRFNEHLGEIRRGSNKSFHKAWRDSLGMKDVLFTSSLMDINLTYENSMKWEEVAVDKWASDAYGLNMIPGGFKGLKFLHKHRITDRVNITFEERDRAIAEYIRQNPRKGIPNPFISELWKDDDYYLRMNEAHPKRLLAEQVRQIRQLANEECSIEQIVKEVNAIDERQVKDVINGKTYFRIR